MTTIKEHKKALAKYLIDNVMYGDDIVGSILADEHIGNRKEIDKVYKAIDQVADLLEDL